MPALTLVFAVVLLLMGPIAYFGSGQASPTAFAPSAIGVLLLVCGLLALKEGLRKHAIHMAAGVTVLGVLGGLGMGIPGLITWLSTGEHRRPLAVVVQLLMGTPCLVLLVFYVRSFIAARRSAGGAGGAEPSQPIGPA